MKHTLEFDMPNDKEDLKWAQNGLYYVLALEDITQYLRNELKYSADQYGEKEIALLQKVKDKVWEILNEREVAGDI